ncbi:MAG: hypothetical protein LBQ18_05945 [Campylobacteraceae bacterium]|jgi:hypothetical protein|nr:hypothetical protein [Campylobacteraceae bacterium]
MARVYNRKEGQIEYQTGTTKILPLSRNYHVLKYYLTITAEIANGASPVYFDDNLFRLISKVSLVANGSLNLKIIPGEKLVYNSIFDIGRRGKTAINKTANGTYIQSQTAEINLIIPNELRPMDTVLFTRNFETYNLEVEFATAAALGTDITVNSATVDVSSQQLIGYSRSKGERINFFKETARKQKVVSDNNALSISLDVNQFYTGFLIAVKRDNVLTDAVLKNILVKSGTVVFMDTAAETIKRINEYDSKIMNFDENVGLYYLDFTPRGRLSDMLNTVQSAGGFNTLDLVLDVKNTNSDTEIAIYPEYVEITSTFEVA